MNSIEWKHIMKEQPEDGSSIVHIDYPYDGHYSICMRTYMQNGSWDEYIKWMEANDLPLPNFWWVYADEFPFPQTFNEEV